MLAQARMRRGNSRAGKGVGLHYLRDDTVVKVDGTRVPRTQAGKLSQFTADITNAARAAYEALLGYRFAVKHAHSQQNPEKDGGNDTLAAARYALYVLNDRYGESGKPVRFHAANTLSSRPRFSRRRGCARGGTGPGA